MSKWFPEFKEGLPQVDGKVFIITGTTSGTGYVAARTAAEKGGDVVLLNRPSDRVTAMMEKLQGEVPNGKFSKIDCDLQDFDSVRKAIAEIKEKYKSIYCLCNNAGIMATPDEATKDGYDTQMQTNHLSHFLLTAELMYLLEAEATANGDARIVNHSSAARNMTPNKSLERKYLEKRGGDLGGSDMALLRGPCWHRYFQSKLANSVFTCGLDNKLKAKGSKVRAIAAHPGGSKTNLGDHLKLGAVGNFFMKVLSAFTQSDEDGTMGILYGMMHTDAQSGVLYGPKNDGMRGPAVPNPPKSYENNPISIKMLWETSEAATGVKFTI